MIINRIKKMHFQSLSDIYFSEACLTFILAGIFCAIIRWLHVCHPYGGRRAEYYYPARKQATFFFAAIALQFPYVLHPSDEATWIYIRAFGVLYYPICFSMLFRRYFDRHKLYRHWKGLAYIIAPLVCLLGLGVMSQAAGHWVAAHSYTICLSAGIAGFLLTLYFISVARLLKRRIDKYHYDNFSCERDFPFLFARKVVYAPLLWLAAMWAILISGNHWVKLYIDIAFATWMVLFLCVILHPQRARAAQKPAAIAETGKPADLPSDPPGEPERRPDVNEEKERVHREVATLIERMYKDSGLRKSDVTDQVGYGRKTLAKEYLSEVGFYNFVNAFRLEHARLYKEKHPRATLDEIAAAAGFRDRFALTHAKNKAKESDRKLIGDFHPEIT